MCKMLQRGYAMPHLSMAGSRQRRVVRRSTHRVVGRFQSLKSGRTVHWESQLERDLLVLMEIDPGILEFREQPLTVRFEEGGRERRYTPDFLVRKAHGLHVVEVKPAALAAKPEWQELFARMIEHFAAEGATYEVLTDQEICRQPRLANAGLLLRYQRHEVAPGVAESLRARLDGGALTLKEVGERVADVYALLARNILATDLDRPIGPDSPIRLA